MLSKFSEIESGVIANAIVYEIASYTKENQGADKKLLALKIKDAISSFDVSESDSLLLLSSYLRTVLNNYTVYLLSKIQTADSENKREDIRTSLYCCSYLISEM